ncbi:MAG: hypothetical protein ACRC5M_00330 [Anaeroplasmataceae bacterium]
MKNKLFSPIFIVKIILIIVLTIISIWIFVDKNIGEKIVLITFGSGILLFAVIRIIPVLLLAYKKDKEISDTSYNDDVEEYVNDFVDSELDRVDSNRKKELVYKVFKYINIGEILINILIAVLLIISGVTFDQEEPSKFVASVFKYFPYLLGFVLYVRGVLHLIAISFLSKKENKINFISNIVFITFAVVLFIKQFTVDELATITASVAAVVAGYFLLEIIIRILAYKKKNPNKSKHPLEDVNDELEV